MASDAARNTTHRLCRPHPDDEADIGEAMEAANRRGLLSLKDPLVSYSIEIAP